MKTETRHLSAAMYRLADEIRAEEGCVTESAETVESVALRLDEQTITIMVLKKALKSARERIATDRECLFDCHKSFKTGQVEDGPGIRGIAEYDDILSHIDAVLVEAA